MSFFKEPQAAAILKHGLLKRYLPIFAMKTGSVAGEVAYLDCYAGPGLYSDGSDGSPSLALATANAIARSRGKASLHGHLVEQDPEAVASLRKLLAHQMTAWHVYQGRAEDHVPIILAGLKPSTPMFAFVDPFGLPLPFDTVVDLMKHGGRRVGSGRIGGAATELLMNFSTSAMRRVGGQLTGNPRAVGPVKARTTMITRMDSVLGGDWWRDIWRSQTPNRVDQIRDGYTERLRKATGGEWATFDIGVSDRWQGPKVYSLLLFTQHEDGVWAFHESLSSANEEYRHYCHRAQGILDFEPLDAREAQWIDHLVENLGCILSEGKAFQPVNRLAEVFGDAFGEAREKHLRKALKRLDGAGKTATDAKGSLAEKMIRPV
jgi:three-Cys-motif partner protein